MLDIIGSISTFIRDRVDPTWKDREAFKAVVLDALAQELPYHQETVQAVLTALVGEYRQTSYITTPTTHNSLFFNPRLEVSGIDRLRVMTGVGETIVNQVATMDSQGIEHVQRLVSGINIQLNSLGRSILSDREIKVPAIKVNERLEQGLNQNQHVIQENKRHSDITESYSVISGAKSLLNAQNKVTKDSILAVGRTLGDTINVQALNIRGLLTPNEYALLKGLGHFSYILNIAQKRRDVDDLGYEPLKDEWDKYVYPEFVATKNTLNLAINIHSELINVSRRYDLRDVPFSFAFEALTDITRNIVQAYMHHENFEQQPFFIDKFRRIVGFPEDLGDQASIKRVENLTTALTNSEEPFEIIQSLRGNPIPLLSFEKNQLLIGVFQNLLIAASELSYDIDDAKINVLVSAVNSEIMDVQSHLQLGMLKLMANYLKLAKDLPKHYRSHKRFF